MNHWLMKTEPSTFGVDDLERAPKRTTTWDGVRNYQARNMLRDDFAKGDRAFLYHSSCEVPGIVALMRVVRAGYRLLKLNTYFTAGVKEVRAWTVPVGATAPQAAGVIHSDFEKGFIRAEVIAFEDFISYKGEQGAKEAGKWRLEGKDYVVQDGDIIHFRFNV